MELHNFEGSLKSIIIDLGVPQTNVKPFTVPHVMFVLPFMILALSNRVSLSYLPSLNGKG
jgi:hypothetical protein